jgi:hypothetical protein
MSWNYRVMTVNRGESYEIHEVYYDEGGQPRSYTMNSVKPYGADLRELRQDLMWMLAALEKPVLTPDDFPEPAE